MARLRFCLPFYKHTSINDVQGGKNGYTYNCYTLYTPKFSCTCIYLKCLYVPPPPLLPPSPPQSMKAVVEKNKPLSVEHRNLLSVAYKNVVGSKRYRYYHSCTFALASLKDFARERGFMCTKPQTIHNFGAIA